MIDTSNVHTENGLVQKPIMFSSGFKVTLSIATGVCGESTCLIIRDCNLYPDGDSRSQRNPEFIIPINYVDELKDLSGLIKDCVKDRNKTLKKKK